MKAHRLLVPVLVLAISASAFAQDQVPAAFRNLKAHQVVEAVAAEREILDLSTVQELRLDSLRRAIRGEPHRYQDAASTKPIKPVQMRPMISKEKAYAEALAILTPQQRVWAKGRFAAVEYRLPGELQARAAPTGKPAVDPLGHEAAGAIPRRESTKPADSAKDPLQHRGGERPSRESGDSGKPTNPVTHRE
jgi:hypothetical protein